MASSHRGRGYARTASRGGHGDTALKRKAESISGADETSDNQSEAMETGLETKVAKYDPDWADDLGTPIVTIFVGKDRKEFYAHKGVLTAKSPFFESCLKNAWAEGIKNEVAFPEDDPDIFKYILKWMYNPQGWLDLTQGPYHDFSLHKFYALADKLMIPRLQNRILDNYRKNMRVANLVANAKGLKTIKSYGLEASPLMTYMKQCHIWSVMTRPDIWTQDEAPDSDSQNGFNITNLRSVFDDRELTNELFLLMVEYAKKAWADPRSLQGCHFHVHPEGDQSCHARSK